MLPLFLSVADEKPHQAECSRFGSRTQPSCGLTADQEPPYTRSCPPSFKARAAAPGALGSSPAPAASSARAVSPAGTAGSSSLAPPVALASSCTSPASFASVLRSPVRAPRRGSSHWAQPGHSTTWSESSHASPVPPPTSTPPSAWPLAGPPCCQAPTHLEPPPCPCLSPPPHLPGFPRSTYH